MGKMDKFIKYSSDLLAYYYIYILWNTYTIFGDKYGKYI